MTPHRRSGPSSILFSVILSSVTQPHPLPSGCTDCGRDGVDTLPPLLPPLPTRFPTRGGPLAWILRLVSAGVPQLQGPLGRTRCPLLPSAHPPSSQGFVLRALKLFSAARIPPSSESQGPLSPVAPHPGAPWTVTAPPLISPESADSWSPG